MGQVVRRNFSFAGLIANFEVSPTALHAYLFSAFTGASIGFARTSHDIGAYEHLVSKWGVIFFLMTLVLVGTARPVEPTRRANRLTRCAVIVFVSAALTEVVRLDRQLPLALAIGLHIDWLNAIAILSALFSAAFCVIETRSFGKIVERRSEMLSNWLAGMIAVIGAILSFSL